MKTRRIRASHCPNCKEKLIGAGGPDCKPSPGDFSICLYCGHLCVFDDKMRLRDPTDDEIVEVAGRVELVLMQKARAEYLRQNPPGRPKG